MLGQRFGRRGGDGRRARPAGTGRRARAGPADLIEAAPGLVDSVSVGKPTLEDVFIRLTGERLAEDLSQGFTRPDGLRAKTCPAA